MSTIIVLTNLTPSSQHALDSACRLFHRLQTKIVLLRVFAFSAGVAGEGIAFAALQDITEQDEKFLAAEKERVLNIYPDLDLETRLVTGNFLEALTDEIEASAARLVVTGTEGDYTRLISWDDQVLDIFIDLPAPVLAIPPHIQLENMRNIAFATNYRRNDLQGPVKVLKRLMSLWECRLYFVHVQLGAAALTEREQTLKSRWQEELAGYAVEFIELQAKEVVSTIDQFCKEQSIDLLAIRPHRAGIWAQILQQKSETRGIVRLNDMPLLALRGSRYL